MDKTYWDEFYRRRSIGRREPSPFCESVLKASIPSGARLLEIGCGYGADAIHFAMNGLSVIACDQSPHLKTMDSRNPVFRVADFTDIDAIRPFVDQPLDFVYSRFSMHAITLEDEERVLDWLPSLLAPGGRFLLEARSVKDALYGQGKPMGPHTFFKDDHCRRFVDGGELKQRLIQRGFTLESFEECAGLAPYGSEDPVCVRLMAQLL